jgi:hypothetical protein
VAKQKHLLYQQHQHVNQHVVENLLHLQMLKKIKQLMILVQQQQQIKMKHHNVQNVKQLPMLQML